VSWLDAATHASQQRDRGFLASPFMAEVRRLEAAEGPAQRAAFLRDTLRALIERHQPRIAALRLPPTVKTLIEKEYARIVRNLAKADDSVFDLGHHSLRCDFRIVGFGRTPVGVEHIEVGGVPRSLLWKGGLAQAIRVGNLFLRAGGPTPFYVGHLTHGIKPHAFLLAYNTKTQEFWHRNVAECLQMNPHIRGFLATSWLYDPQLAHVSPHLAFLREGSLAHGAVLAHVGPTEGAVRYALAHAPDRRRLYDEGKYVPTSHAVIWTRDAMLTWAGLR
jgi:hypothetical protein